MQVDERLQELKIWLESALSSNDFSCESASSDASFRRYFRVIHKTESFVVMDAPPSKEDCEPFIFIAELLCSYGVQAPTIYHQSVQKGFLMLSDFGSKSYLDALADDTADSLYKDAANALHSIQTIPANTEGLPLYTDALLKQEMSLFNEWFVGGLLGIDVDAADNKALEAVQSCLAASATEQPQVFVHRDYHSRNLMLTENSNPGVIDFQDAVIGPMTYDLVSLYRDCYISWPDPKVYAWLDEFLLARAAAGIKDNFTSQQFYQWFDWMGVQRHMKAIGIFSRLLLRDGKPGYLEDIPRTLMYVVDVCAKYPALKPLDDLIKRHRIVARIDEVVADYSVL